MKRLESRGARHVIALALGITFFTVLLGTASDLGFARDEGFYYHAARDYQLWFEDLVESPSAALSREGVDRRWRYNHEHPALMKTLFGFSWRVFHERLGILRPSTALRLPAMVLAALCIYLTVLFGWRLHGPLAGIAAGVFLAAQPRFFYHSHLACFDVPVTAMWLLTVYAVYRSSTSKRWVLGAGLAFGVCLCTKLNSFFLPPILMVHHLSLWWLERRKGLKERPFIPPWLVAMAVIGPLVFFVHWPWIWYETFERIGFYLGFHRAHPYYNMEYFGVTYFRPPLPISFPFVMTAITLPATTLVLALIGAADRLRPSFPKSWKQRLNIAESVESPRAESGADLLIALNAIIPIVIIALPTVPIFGGTKHWLPAMPMIAILAGLGLSRAVSSLRLAFPATRPALTKVVVVFCCSLVFLPAIVETWASHPNGLAHYNVLAGGVQGSADTGFNRQFWGYTTSGVVDWLNEEVGRNERVFFHDTAFDAVRLYRDDGTLRRDIRWSDVQSSQFALVHHEQHMAHVEYEIWERYQTTVPTRVLTHEGVPLVSVYRRSERSLSRQP